MSMTLHFLNVGNGDCTIIELPDDNVMMVDICNGGGTNRALTDPVAVLGTRRELVRYIQTHPDMDHLDGLATLEAKCKISNFWDTQNNKPRPDFSSRFAKGKLADWDAYQRLRQNAVHLYRSTSSLTLKDGTELPYELFVLHPTERAVSSANQSGEWNNSAYVLLLKEKGFKALLAGDIDDGIWAELCQWASRDSAVRNLVSSICVFKTSHHGRRSGYCGADWLRLTNPGNIIISKGTVPGEHSAYGNYHNKVGAENLWLTSQGDVVVRYDSAANRYSTNQT